MRKGAEMADLKKRATIPKIWEKDPSIKIPGFGMESLLKIAAGQLLGGPLGAAVALASECLSSPNVVQSSEVLFNLTGAVNHAVQALSTTDDLITENEKDVLNKIALVLGYPPVAPEILPATAVAKRLEEIGLLHKAAMGEVTGEGEDELYTPYLKKIAEKKTSDWWSLKITVTSYPTNLERDELNGGQRVLIGLGSVVWRFEGHFVQRQFVNFKQTRLIAPFPGIEDYEVEKLEDVSWTIQKLKWDPPPAEEPE
jgi:hypothetical protein